MQPGLPLPEPWRGTDQGSFAQFTVEVRFPDIARRTRAGLELPALQAALFDRLLEELPHAPLRQLADADAPDADEWKTYLEPYLGRTWLEVPWFFSEVYFYRRLLEACGYYQPGMRFGVDPYMDQKRAGLAETRAPVAALSTRLERALAAHEGPDRAAAEIFFEAALWGNQSDLSLWPAGAEDQPGHADAAKARQHLLVDDFPRVWDHLQAAGRETSKRADFLIDNAGFELVCDLCLADYLLSSGLLDTVQLHLKQQPFFVSDTMVTDVHETVQALRGDEHAAVRSLAKRLVGHLEEGRLQLSDHRFWVSPLAAWEMPSDLYEDLSHSRLVISKGDLNYRRLLGDRRWPFDTPFGAVTDYFPAPLLALRVLKSEVAAGLPPQQVEGLFRSDPGWRTDGKWGMIQYRG